MSGVEDTGASIPDGGMITIRGCYAGEAEIRISKGQELLNSYDVTVSSSGFSASLADADGNNPESIEAGGSNTFTVSSSDAANENAPPRVWVGVNYDGNNHLTTGSCPAGQDTGVHRDNGQTITIYGCSIGTAEVRIYKDQLILNSYTVTVTGEADDASLSPVPSSTSITVGGSQTFTLSTNVASGVLVGVNYDGANRLSTGSCPADGPTGVTLSDGGTVTINGCSAGTAEIRLYKLNTLLQTYTVTVSP